MAMLINALGTIAAGATVTVTVPVADMQGHLEIKLYAYGAAVSTTSGLVVSYQVTTPTGTVASNQPGYTLNPVAGQIVTNGTVTPVSYSWDRFDHGVIEAIVVSIHNTDATNAVTFAVESNDQFNVGR